VKRVAAMLAWFLPFGFIVEGLGFAFEDETFSITVALGWSALLVSTFGLMELVQERVEHPLNRFLVLAAALSVLLVLIAPLVGGDGPDPMPNLFLAVGIAALFVGLDHLQKREDHRRKHPAT
jgi:hypothetical protein